MIQVYSWMVCNAGIFGHNHTVEPTVGPYHIGGRPNATTVGVPPTNRSPDLARNLHPQMWLDKVCGQSWRWHLYIEYTIITVILTVLTIIKYTAISVSLHVDNNWTNSNRDNCCEYCECIIFLYVDTCYFLTIQYQSFFQYFWWNPCLQWSLQFYIISATMNQDQHIST